MITVSELKEKAANRYESVLKKVLLGENPFPLSIPYKRPRRSGDPSAILHVKEMLRSQSKEKNGFGPTISFSEARTRRFGLGVIPGEINFETLEDLTRYIGKKPEADRIIAHSEIVTRAFPTTRVWITKHLRLLGEGDVAVWHGIVKIVNFFIQNPRPWIYPRELSLGLHTKFLEEHYKAVSEILIQVAPLALNESYSNWQDRLGLRSSSELIEGRFLDPSLAPHLPQHMLAPVKEWNRCAFNLPIWVLITENRTTFLTLPMLSGCLALLGKGYAVTRLAQIEKLHTTQIYYWGDIDQHGFEILASIRSHLPNAISCMMDEATLARCLDETSIENVEATLPADFVAVHLTAEERLLWQKCTLNHQRLEQEHIPRNLVICGLNMIRPAMT